MEVVFYAFSKRTNSTRLPTGGTGVECRYKDRVSVYEPILLLTSFDDSWTYAKIGDLYFFVEDYIRVNNNQVEVRMIVDVLASWKSEILSTSAFVALSSSSYDGYLTDTRHSTNEIANKSVTKSLLFDDFVNFDEDFQCVVLSYASADGTGTSWLTEGQVVLLMMELGSESYNNFLIEFEKQFSGAYEALIGAKRLPFKFYERGATGRVTLGTYDTGIDGKFMTTATANYETNLTIPWQYDDFRNLAPYTTIQIYLPSYGYLEVNPSDFIGRDTINIKASVDFYTGNCTYLIDDIAKCEGGFGTDMPVGFVSKNATAIINGGLALAGAIAGGVATGGVGFVAGGMGVIDSIIASQQRSVGGTGGSPSMSAMYAGSPTDWGKVKLVLISHDTAENPNDLLASNGRVLNQIRTLNTLSGYCQTANASVSCNAPKRYKDEINGLLDGGVYIE